MFKATKKINGSGLLQTGPRSTQLTHLQRAVFSYYHNFHHPTEFFVNGRKHTTDYNTDLYQPHVRAFLTKRWTTKREIPP